MENKFENTDKPLNEVLKDGRIGNNLTQEQMAQKTNISRQTLSKYENGEQEPTLDYLKKFCMECKKSADQILGISIAASAGLSMMARNIAIAAERLDPKTQEEIFEIIKKLGNMLNFFI